jgi:flagellar biosynthesis regulator FlbT
MHVQFKSTLNSAHILIQSLFIYEEPLSKVSNALSITFALKPMNDYNYPSWREKIDMILTLIEIDYVIDNPKSIDIMLAIERMFEAANSVALIMVYDFERVR